MYLFIEPERFTKVLSHLLGCVINSYPHIWFPILLTTPSEDASLYFRRNNDKTLPVLFVSLFSTLGFCIHTTPCSDGQIWSIRCSRDQVMLIQHQETNQSQTSIQTAVSIKFIQEKILAISNAYGTDIILSLNPMIRNVWPRTNKRFNQ
jgi:hypothetical protein